MVDDDQNGVEQQEADPAETGDGANEADSAEPVDPDAPADTPAADETATDPPAADEPTTDPPAAEETADDGLLDEVAEADRLKAIAEKNAVERKAKEAAPGGARRRPKISKVGKPFGAEIQVGEQVPLHIANLQARAADAASDEAAEAAGQRAKDQVIRDFKSSGAARASLR